MRPTGSSIRVALLIVMSVAVARVASGQGRVGGVIGDESGRGIKAATIIADHADTGQTFTATTDDKGRFGMIGLRSGEWRFIAQAPGYEPQVVLMRVRANPNPPITFGLRKVPGPSGVLGNVVAKDLQADLAAADALFNKKRWDEAASAYRSLMEKTPALAILNLQIAAAHRNKKEYDAAIAAYSDLLKADATNDKARVGIATVQLERGDSHAAEETLLKAATAPNAGREVLYTLGDIKFDAGDIDEAAKWYSKAADADPSWGKPLYKLGLCALKKGNRPAAAELMAKVVVVDPESPEAILAKSSIDQPAR